ncbi:MAG: HAMP domain-containing protein, partial [Candidatus Dormibacteraeota bacterium]|nr:HAMP domain-containing protein [Candidatus Dormibacteraeota bacterium]
MIRRLRSSFAAKLLVGGIALALLIVGSVGGYLLYSRDNQTRAGALSNSDNRVAVMREVLEQFTGEQSYATAKGLATQTPLIAALAGAVPSRAVPALFAGSPPVNLESEVLVITDSAGKPLYTRAAPDLGGVDAAVFDGSQAIAAALSGTQCAFAKGAGACGLEILSDGLPVYSVAVPVTNGLTVVGSVAYIAPLGLQLERFATLFQFPTAFIPAAEPSLELRQQGVAVTSGSAPSDVTTGIQAGQDLVHATYNAPTGSGGATQAVAGSFVAVAAPGGGRVAGYLGIEVPLSQFLGDEATDELTLGLITLFVLLALTLLIIVFVEIVVRRPIRRLERGVARIAGGDYTSPIVVRSNDELGRLAAGVNRMRDSIRVYTTEIEDARKRLDSAVERVGNVSRALTTTTGGVAALQNEVVRAAAGIAGEGAMAVLATRQDDALHVQAVFPEDTSPQVFDGWEHFSDVLGGAVVRETNPDRGSLVAVPMFYQDRVGGALCVVNEKTTRPIAEDEEDVLVVLANNAAVAMENARLFEQERETVRRLRQLDSMKNDFLSTVQHELRTPLTAIIGLSDLLEMCWEMWDDARKVDAIRDIQIAGRNLQEIVETIIDFSALADDHLRVQGSRVTLRTAVETAVAS